MSDDRNFIICQMLTINENSTEDKADQPVAQLDALEDIHLARTR